jgi:azurin
MIKYFSPQSIIKKAVGVAVCITLLSCSQQASQPIETVNIDSANIGAAYNRDTIFVKSGSRVELNFKNTASDGGNSHNWVLVKAGSKETVSIHGVSAGPVEDFIPNDDPNVIAHTALVRPGATTSVSFDAPPPGTYEYLCSYPGHSSTMFGKFVVR